MLAGVRIERSGVEKKGREVEKECLGVEKTSWRFKRNGRGVGKKDSGGLKRKDSEGLEKWFRGLEKKG